MAGRRSTGAAHDGGDVVAGDVVAGDVVAGDVVAGVRLTALVGRGSAGVVWAGTEVASGARVAVKLLDRPSDGREAALLAAVRHPHLLPLRRCSSDPPALVTDLAAGGSLADQVAARGTLPPGEVVTVLAPLADALAALHVRGVVHGDVTAGNVLFVDRGRPVLADLGVAGLVGDGTAWATPGFAAPEVLAGARPGPAADVHGLGAAGWLALTGSVPPPEEDRLPLGLLAPGCPPGLLAAVTAALDPDPLRRPAPEDLAREVRAACPGLVVRLVPAAARGVAPEEAVTYRVREAAAADPPPAGGRVRRVRRAAVGLVARAAGGIGALAPAGLPPAPAGTGRQRAGGGARTVRGVGVAGLLAGVAAGVLVAAVVVTGLPAAGLPGEPSGAVAEDRAEDRAEDPSEPGEEPARPTPGMLAADELRATVTGLVRARETALRSGDVRALGLVHDREGTTWAADERLLRDGPVDVAYEVLGVAPVDGRPGDARVRLRTTAGGTSTTEDVVLTLVARAEGWRLSAVAG